jgi:hypothetical protein
MIAICCMIVNIQTGNIVGFVINFIALVLDVTNLILICKKVKHGKNR